MTTIRRSGRVWVACLSALCLIGFGVAGMGGHVPRARVLAQDEAPALQLGVVHDAGHVPDDLGVTWERVTFEWAAFQPDGPDDFVSEAVDLAWLAEAQDAGREVVGLIVGTPAWASDSGAASAVPRGLAQPVDDPANVWAAFVVRLAGHFGPQGITRWIIYDTPDVRPGEGAVRFVGSEAEYARLLRVARAALDAVDPRADVIAAAADGWADAAAGREPYLARLLRALAAEPGPLPVQAVLVRALAGTPTMWDRVTGARALLDAAGHTDVAIWLEAGMSPDPAALLGVTPAQQADAVAQAAGIALAAGVARLAIYRLADPAPHGALFGMPGEQPWGLIAADGSARPALAAYRTLIDTLGEARLAAYHAHPAADVLELTADGRLIIVAWARRADAIEVRITGPEAGERAGLAAPAAGMSEIESGPDEWPAAFVVPLPAPEPDPNGFVTVAGSPRVLVLDDTGSAFYRVMWIVVNGQYVRLR